MECPICGGSDKENNFKCPECGRDNLCGIHYDVNELVCEECAAKRKGKTEKPKVKRDVNVGETAPESGDIEKVDKTPFYPKKVPCPVCGVLTTNRFFKQSCRTGRSCGN